MTTPSLADLLNNQPENPTQVIRETSQTFVGQRRGWNCTLSYLRGNVRYAYRLRVGRVVHGLNLIFDESTGRMSRAFYPHRLSNAQFSLGLILDGTRIRRPGKPWAHVPTEYELFMSWLHDYMTYLLNQDTAVAGDLPVMSVSVPKYDFFREGVPIGPVLFGDHVGSMIWTPALVFETTRDYLEPASTSQIASKFLGGLTNLDQEAQFFYPTSPMAEVGGNEAPFIFDQGAPNADGYGVDTPLTPEQQAAAEAGEN